MASQKTTIRSKRAFYALALSVAMIGMGAFPLVGAQTGLENATSGAQRSVGEFDVTDDGTADGSVVSSTVADTATSGTVLEGFSIKTSSSASTEIFSSISIDGFSSTKALQGVGTSQLSVEGDGALVTITDNVNALMMIEATGSASQTVTFELPSGVTISQDASASTDNVWTVRAEGAAAIEGALILVKASGETAAAAGNQVQASAQGQATATLMGGEKLIFRAHSSYEASASQKASVKAFNDAAVSAIASGSLVAETTSEFSSGSHLLVDTEYFATSSADVNAEASGRVVTDLRAATSATAAASGGAILAYDLDYVDIAARNANEVAVYVNGELATQASSATQVEGNAAQGVPSYFATTAQGRVLVLASTSNKASAETITIVQVPDASATARTLARLDAQLGVQTRVAGGFEILGDLKGSAQGSGQVVGSFSSFFATEFQGQASVTEYTDMGSSTEVFAQIQFAADAAAGASSEVKAAASGSGSASATGSDGSVDLATSVAGQVVSSARFDDTAFSTIQVEAISDTATTFTLGKGVRATAVSESVIRLEGPSGDVGYLILADAQGQADAAASGGSSLVSSTAASATGAAQATVEAQLAAGDEVIFRASGEAQARANAELIANAIAAGQVASEIDVGLIANAVAASDVDYTSTLDARVVTEAAASSRGTIALEVSSTVSQASAIVLDADQSSLQADAASDIAVTVNGQAAALAGSSAEVLAQASGAASAAAQAKYFVEANVEGQTQVLLGLPNLVAGSATDIVVTSQLEADAKVKAAVDSFGAFKAGAGGSARGEVVALVSKPDFAMLLDYAVTAQSTIDAQPSNTQVFDSIAFGTKAMASASASASNSLKMEGPQGSIEAFDASSAVVKVVAKASGEASFDLGPNVEATAISDNVVMVENKGTGFVGAIISSDAAASGSAASNAKLDASAAGEVTAQLAAGTQVLFKAFSGFEAELTRGDKEAQANAIARGEIVGHIIAETDPATGATSTAAINYHSDVLANVKVASPEEVTVLIDSSTSVGKSVILSFDRATISGLIEGKAEILIDGKAVGQASSYEDALSADADEYYLITTEGEVGLQAIVSLEHFSTRTVTVQKPAGTNMFLWTTVALAAVVVGQAVLPRLIGKKSGTGQKKW